MIMKYFLWYIQAVFQSNSGKCTNQHNNPKKLEIPKILSSQKQIPQPNIQSNKKHPYFPSFSPIQLSNYAQCMLN